MPWRQTYADLSRQRMWSALLAIVCIGTITATALGDATGPEASGATVEVELHDGLLTLHASSAPLVEIIRAIGKEAGFETLVHGELDDVLTRSLIALPLEQALRQLLKDVSNVMLFEESQAPRLTQVWLYGHTISGRTSAAPSFETPEATVIVQALDTERATLITAIRERARAGELQAIQELTRLLREDVDPAVRSQAAGALGEIGDAAAISALQMGVEDSEQLVRMRSIRALAPIKSDQSTQVLADLLFSHPDTRTRLLAVWALGQQDSPLARSYLEAAKVDGNTLVQQAVARARATSGDSSRIGGDATSPSTDNTR
ncbi:MAG: HEAT repeat domain-containing protein [Gammaproteobacteria bacterium]|nr:HEAT repeat domain-containing protein [Gammaproteobacteria bacterium]